MLRWALTFLLVALVAGALGLTGVAGAAVGIAKALFFVAIVLFIVTAIAGIAAGGSVANKLSSKETKREDHHLSHR
jgi:uncharacterized membrane protein YtjA (UPF0391 family)